ncbi:ClC family H(+)/Cl(-) exchange transporter, partial [Vibrio parahaemolyticus]|nr:ClC family H(+)/Cl(-) exchange transporter [Vibrio parahaemolyticus]
FGVFGVIFNKLITVAQDSFVAIHKNDRKRYLIVGSLLGGIFGLLLLYVPQLAGGGIGLIPDITNGNYSVSVLVLLFFGRVITTLLCFGSGA